MGLFFFIFFGSSINNVGSFEGEGTKNVPRIIVFVMGGACFLEFRVSYEVTNDRKNWEVIVGKWGLFSLFFPLSFFFQL